jgi:hypothetical protein
MDLRDESVNEELSVSEIGTAKRNGGQRSGRMFQQTGELTAERKSKPMNQSTINVYHTHGLDAPSTRPRHT